VQYSRKDRWLLLKMDRPHWKDNSIWLNRIGSYNWAGSDFLLTNKWYLAANKIEINHQSDKEVGSSCSCVRGFGFGSIIKSGYACWILKTMVIKSYSRERSVTRKDLWTGWRCQNVVFGNGWIVEDKWWCKNILFRADTIYAWLKLT